MVSPPGRSSADHFDPDQPTRHPLQIGGSTKGDASKGGGKGSPQPDRPGNDKRSDVKNPNNSDYADDQANRKEQAKRGF